MHAHRMSASYCNQWWERSFFQILQRWKSTLIIDTYVRFRLFVKWIKLELKLSSTRVIWIRISMETMPLYFKSTMCKIYIESNELGVKDDFPLQILEEITGKFVDAWQYYQMKTLFIWFDLLKLILKSPISNRILEFLIVNFCWDRQSQKY